VQYSRKGVYYIILINFSWYNITIGIKHNIFQNLSRLKETAVVSQVLLISEVRFLSSAFLYEASLLHRSVKVFIDVLV